MDVLTPIMILLHKGIFLTAVYWEVDVQLQIRYCNTIVFVHFTDASLFDLASV